MKTRIALVASYFAVIILLQAAVLGFPEHSSAALAEDTSLFLPVISKPILEDLVIDRLIISQAVQDGDNGVPLVAQRNTVVRVFARRIDGVIPDNITVSLNGTRDGSPLGTLVSAPRTVPDSPDRAVLGSTFNFVLPAGWLAGTVTLVATVDSADLVVEASETNNVVQKSVIFNDVPPLTIKIVPIRYVHTGSNSGTYPGQQRDVTTWLQRTFPVNNVNVEFHPGMDFTGNLEQASEWGRLLDAVTFLKSWEIGRFHPTVYYALVPISNGITSWFGGGIAGIGWVLGGRISAGLNLSSIFGSEGAFVLAAHEIGHNFGRYHAPCGVQTNASFPYPGASIGQYGLDIINTSYSLIRPEDGYVDFMSYCDPTWVSDYTYKGLYQDQMANGLPQTGPVQDSLVIRATFDDEGLPTLQPTYILPQRVSAKRLTSPGYAVQLLDAAGRVTASQLVEVWVAQEPGLSVRAIHAAVPLPEEAVAAVRLMQSGRELARRDLASPTGPMRAEAEAALSQASADGRIRLTWNAPNTPAMVSYTADEGQSWTLLGIDVLGGEMLLDRSQLTGIGGRFEILLADRVEPFTLTAEFD